ncbi:MAG: Na/Pi cotransporter family protein, partial [Deltaproteobacteria bacterium]|nr:Na/Pi cotransporter family protein [Deltaproteobacteria bacterium]
YDRDVKRLIKWRNQEDALDNLQRDITHFLVQVMQKSIMPEESREVASLTRMTNNFERIGDGIENIAELMEEMINQDLYLSEGALHDYKIISGEVRQFLNYVMDAIRREDGTIMEEADGMENTINDMREEMKNNHLMRLQSGACTVDPGLILIDMLTAFEKMGDYCYNIAQAVAGVK